MPLLPIRKISSDQDHSDGQFRFKLRCALEPGIPGVSYLHSMPIAGWPSERSPSQPCTSGSHEFLAELLGVQRSTVITETDGRSGKGIHGNATDSPSQLRAAASSHLQDHHTECLSPAAARLLNFEREQHHSLVGGDRAGHGVGKAQATCILHELRAPSAEVLRASREAQFTQPSAGPVHSAGSAERVKPHALTEIVPASHEPSSHRHCLNRLSIHTGKRPGNPDCKERRSSHRYDLRCHWPRCPVDRLLRHGRCHCEGSDRHAACD